MAARAPAPHPWTARVAAWSISHRRAVIAAWILLAVAGVAAIAGGSSRLSFRFDLPGQPAYETNQAILGRFGGGGDNAPLIAVIRLPPSANARSPEVGQQLRAVSATVKRAVPGARIASSPADGAALRSADGHTIFLIIYPRIDPRTSDPYVLALPRLQAALAGRTVAGEPVKVTGATILAGGGHGGSASVLVETLLAGLGALVVLAIVFGSLLALLPLLIAAVAIPTTFIVIYGLTYVTFMSSLVQNIVALIGLGVAIDYALLICTRWREARARADARAAVIEAAGTAGHSVLLSGVTVSVSLAALALTRVPFLRSIGLAGLVIPLTSIAVSLTLLPVVLDALDRRLEWPRRRTPGVVSAAWTRIATAVVRHRVLAAIGSLLVLGVMAAPLLSLRLGEPQATATAQSAPPAARDAYQSLARAGIGAGVLRPTEILLPGSAAGLPTVAGVTTIAPRDWMSGGERVIDAWSPADASSSAGAQALARIRRAFARVPGARIGGAPAQDDDFIRALYGSDLVIIVGAIVLVTLVLLTRSLRSVWLPVKALALNVISLAAAFGVLTFIWQEGHGTQLLFSTPATGAITLWVPLAVFSLLFGLSMDYEVFILTRIEEEYEAVGDTDRAIVRAIGRTGRLVSSAALILFLAFVALGGVPETDVKILSTGLAVGIIIDATIIRGVLAPALVSLLGPYNWWLPAPLARLLRVTPRSPGPSQGRA